MPDQPSPPHQPPRQRPVFLNLLHIRLPVAGVMSILHRASGLLMFLLIPVLLYLLDQSLRSAEGFAETAALLHGTGARLLLIAVIWALSHHLLAGIRFLLIDLDIGVQRQAMRRSAWVVNIAAPILTAVIATLVLP